MRRCRFSNLMLVVGAALPTNAAAAVLRVPSEYVTINDGLDAAASGDTVLVAAGTYSEFDARVGPLGDLISSVAFLKDGVVLRSEEGPENTVIDMNAAAPGSFPRVIRGSQLSADVWVEGFTVTSDLVGVNGATIGFSLAETVTATFNECIFRDIGHGDISEVALVSSSPVRVFSCQFLNIDGTSGSALSARRSVEVVGSLFENCRSGAISLDEGSIPASNLAATFTSTVFRNNFKDTGGGGAIFIRRYDVVELTDCVFEGNVSTGTADAIRLSSVGVAELSDSVFRGNHANGGGAGGGSVS